MTYGYNINVEQRELLIEQLQTVNVYSSFQTFAVFWMLYALFCVILRSLNCIRRRFET
jgi:hypothetical protein